MYLVVQVGLTVVAPHWQVWEAEYYGMLGHRAVDHHVLVDIATAEHLQTHNFLFTAHNFLFTGYETDATYSTTWSPWQHHDFTGYQVRQVVTWWWYK